MSPILLYFALYSTIASDNSDLVTDTRLKGSKIRSYLILSSIWPVTGEKKRDSPVVFKGLYTSYKFYDCFT